MGRDFGLEIHLLWPNLQRLFEPCLAAVVPNSPSMEASGINSQIGGDLSIIALRSTQRARQHAPRSCTRCSRLKIKCGQKIPCHQCLRKGVREACSKEAVLVRGAVIT
jgi:hypothetical protein